MFGAYLLAMYRKNDKNSTAIWVCENELITTQLSQLSFVWTMGFGFTWSLDKSFVRLSPENCDFPDASTRNGVQFMRGFGQEVTSQEQQWKIARDWNLELKHKF